MSKSTDTKAADCVYSRLKSLKKPTCRRTAVRVAHVRYRRLEFWLQRAGRGTGSSCPWKRRCPGTPARTCKPVGGRLELALFIKQAADEAHAPVGRTAQADFVAHVGAFGRVVPDARRRVALVDRTARVAGALVIHAIPATCVVRVVLDSFCVARKVGAAVDEVERADLAVDGQRGVRELVVVAAIVEDRDLERLEVLTFGTRWQLVEDALGFDFLVGHSSGWHPSLR